MELSVRGRSTWREDKAEVSGDFGVTRGGGGQNGNSWQLQWVFRVGPRR